MLLPKQRDRGYVDIGLIFGCPDSTPKIRTRSNSNIYVAAVIAASATATTAKNFLTQQIAQITSNQFQYMHTQYS